MIIDVQNGVSKIRERFVMLAQTRKSDSDMLEIIGCQFVADAPSVFGTPNEDWHRRELAWYLSQSLSINDIEPPIPTIWKSVASKAGTINSNYGWCIFSKDNGLQFENAIQAIVDKHDTRQATMIYTRPNMHYDSKTGGRYDFMCTNTVQLFFRHGRLIYVVNMRSSDAVLGYKGDYAWHKYVQDRAVETLILMGVDCVPGEIIWNANSFHIYPKHIPLVLRWDEENWERK